MGPLACVVLMIGPWAVLAVDAPPKAAAAAVSADTVLRQMSEKICTARSFSFKALREIASGLAGGDGLQGNTKIAVTVRGS